MSKLLKSVVDGVKSHYEQKGENSDFIADRVARMEKHLQTKDALDTVTPNNGAEYVPAENNDGTLVDLMVKKGGLVAALQPGFLGSNLGQNQAINIKGEDGQATVNAEWTTGNFYNVDPEQTIITDKVLANQKLLTARVGISALLEKYSEVDVLDEAEKAVATQINQAIEDAVLNADSSTGATGNINSNDQLASTTYGADAPIVNYDNGLRKGFLSGTVGTDFIDLGAIAGFADIAELIKLAPADFTPSDYFLTMDHKSYAELMGKDDFKNAYQWGNTTNDNTSRTGMLPTVAGMPVVVSKYMRQTIADGTVSGAAPATNTRGTILLAKRNIIQHGFVGAIDTDVQKIVGRGLMVSAAISFGFANINKLANTPARIIGGINVTV